MDQLYDCAPWSMALQSTSAVRTSHFIVRTSSRQHARKVREIPSSRSSGTKQTLSLGDAKLPNGPSGWSCPICGIFRRLICHETESSDTFDHLKYGGSTYAEQSKIDELQASEEDRWLHHRPGELRSSKSVCKAGELALLSSVLPCK